MQNSQLFIHATNIHQGGGKALLLSIIKNLPASFSIVLLVDSRMTLPPDMHENVRVKKVYPSILQRTRTEKWLASTVKSQDVVLCFGNLPPLFKLQGHTVVFIQNRYLVEKARLGFFSFRVRMRILVERWWLYNKKNNADEFVVQTPTMKRLLDVCLNKDIPVYIRPFVPSGERNYKRQIVRHEEQQEKKENYDFFYVASGEPHKNHRKLIEAWCLLAGEAIFPSLLLTLNEAKFPLLCDWIEKMAQRYGLKIVNIGNLSQPAISDAYKTAGALIYPSTFESLGLPLIEARQAGLPVVGAELDYVRDILDPEQSFDPESSISISRAVKRYMKHKELELPLLTAKDFIAKILASDGRHTFRT